jgi:hypothetical protein
MLTHVRFWWQNRLFPTRSGMRCELHVIGVIQIASRDDDLLTVSSGDLGATPTHLRGSPCLRGISPNEFSSPPTCTNNLVPRDQQKSHSEAPRRRNWHVPRDFTSPIAARSSDSATNERLVFFSFASVAMRSYSSLYSRTPISLVFRRFTSISISIAEA